MHLEIANLFDETNLATYKDTIFNKKYELIF